MPPFLKKGEHAGVRAALMIAGREHHGQRFEGHDRDGRRRQREGILAAGVFSDEARAGARHSGGRLLGGGSRQAAAHQPRPSQKLRGARQQPASHPPFQGRSARLARAQGRAHRLAEDEHGERGRRGAEPPSREIRQRIATSASSGSDSLDGIERSAESGAPFSYSSAAGL